MTLCEKLSLKEVDLVKLDVEGAELNVINGMKKYTPLHIVGVWHGLTRLLKLEQLLEDKGYKVLYRRSNRNIGVFYARHVR